MPALAKTCKNIGLSFEYDTLTVYSNDREDEKKSASLWDAMEDCHYLAYVSMAGSTPKLQREIGFERYVLHVDDDHAMYHNKDSHDMEEDHFHIKFSSLLTPTKLDEVLNVFVKRGLISLDEKMSFIEDCNKRYSDKNTELNAELKGDKSQDRKAIINYIQSCKDNDILVNLHDFLLIEKFDYLRACTGFIKTTFWQGTSRSRAGIFDTSKTWAMIEKAFALQMAHNVKTDCGHLTPTAASQRASQMRASHNFFAIKRYSLFADDSTSASFNAFNQNNVQIFNDNYRSHFAEYKS